MTDDMMVREFGPEDVLRAENQIEPTARRLAPRRIYADRDAPAIADADDLGDLDDAYDPRRPHPVMLEREIDRDDVDWASHIGLSRMITSREGATFTRLAEDVFVISVYGGQYLHHDRHLAEMPSANGFSEHTWNLVVEGSDTQMLMVEVGPEIYSALPLALDNFVYFNTVNRHAVTRLSPQDTVVIVQVDGFGPDDDDLAIARIAEVLAARPDPMAV